MYKILIFFIPLLMVLFARAQSDFLVLEKHNKSIEKLIPGSYISFQPDTRQWIEASINRIVNDTLYLHPFEEVHGINAWGMPLIDTVWGNSFKVPVSRIYAFPRKEESVEFIRNGRIFQIGAAGYILLNVINTLSSGDQLFDNNNGKSLLIAVGVFAMGTIMHIARKPILVPGKKYRLVCVKLN